MMTEYALVIALIAIIAAATTTTLMTRVIPGKTITHVPTYGVDIRPRTC